MSQGRSEDISSPGGGVGPDRSARVRSASGSPIVFAWGAAGDEQGVTERSSQAEAETTRSPTRSESRDQTTRRGASRAEGADAERMAQQGRRCGRDRRRCDAREPEGRSEADERSVRKPRADDESCDGCESRCVQDVQGASALSGGCPSCPGRSMGQRRTQYR